MLRQNVTALVRDSALKRIIRPAQQSPYIQRDNIQVIRDDLMPAEPSQRGSDLRIVDSEVREILHACVWQPSLGDALIFELSL